MENEAGNPAGDALRGELADIISNPNNPLHAGYVRGDPHVKAHLDRRYADVYGRGIVELSDGIEIRGSRPAREFGPGALAEDTDSAFHTRVHAECHTRGIDLSSAQAEGDRLFAGPDGEVVLAVLEDQVLVGLAPEAETQAHAEMGAYLADLHRLRDQGQVGSSDPIDEATVTAQLEAGLRQEFGVAYDMVRADINTTLAHLSAGDPTFLSIMERRLFDGLPSSARVPVLLRTARALITLSHLRQSVT